MDTSSTTSAVAVETPARVVASPSSNSTGKKKHKSRRGRGSKGKASEQFRSQKNEMIGIPTLENRVAQFNLEFGITPEDLFGSPCLNISLVKPMTRVVVTTHLLPRLCENVVHTLISGCKVPSNDVERDIETVQLAASYQLFAKFFFASMNTPFTEHDAHLLRQAHNVSDRFEKCLLPIAVFIDQIGQFELDGQVYVPDDVRSADGVHYTFNHRYLGSRGLFERDRYRFLQTFPINMETGEAFPHLGQCVQVLQDGAQVLGARGGEMHLWIHDRERYDGFQGDRTMIPILHPQIAQFVQLSLGTRLPTFLEVDRRYGEFLLRCNRRLAGSKVVDLNLKKGVGTAAQIVGCDAQDDDGCVDVYCHRSVPNSAMFMAGALELGRYDQVLTGREGCFIRANVNVGNALARMTYCLSDAKK